MYKQLILFLLLLAVFALNACRNINSSFMFKTPKDYSFAKPDSN